MDDAIWDVTVFTKNRERLLDGDIAEAFFQAVLPLHRGWNATGSAGECEKLAAQGCEERLSARRSWQCDGGLSWGEAVEPDARIEDGPRYEDRTQRQGQRSEGELQRESGGEPQRTDRKHRGVRGQRDRDAALVMLEQIPGTRPVTVGGDKAYDTADFVAECRNLTKGHAAHSTSDMPSVRGKGSALVRASMALHRAAQGSVPHEECFGWLKTIALMRKVRHRGISRVGWVFTCAAAAYNSVRMRNLANQATEAEVAVSQCARRSENESAGHQRMQPEPFPNNKITKTGENLSRGVHFSAAC